MSIQQEVLCVGAKAWINYIPGHETVLDQFSILPDQVWGLNIFSVKALSYAEPMANVIVEFVTSDGDILTSFCTHALKALTKDQTYETKSGQPLLVIGPYESPKKIFMLINHKMCRDKFEIFANAYLVRLSPAISFGVHGDNKTEVAQETKPRDLYLIEDEDAQDYPQDGFHEMANGQWHPCKKCLEQIHGESHRDAMFDEEVEAGSFEEVGDNFSSSHGMVKIKCNRCGSEGNEHSPPVCSSSCQDRLVNSIIFSKGIWHTAPDGSYHFCECCFDAATLKYTTA